MMFIWDSCKKIYVGRIISHDKVVERKSQKNILRLRCAPRSKRPANVFVFFLNVFLEKCLIFCIALPQKHLENIFNNIVLLYVI